MYVYWWQFEYIFLYTSLFWHLLESLLSVATLFHTERPLPLVNQWGAFFFFKDIDTELLLNSTVSLRLVLAGALNCASSRGQDS